jgi:hypothetical protein
MGVTDPRQGRLDIPRRQVDLGMADEIVARDQAGT